MKWNAIKVSQGISYLQSLDLVKAFDAMTTK